MAKDRFLIAPFETGLQDDVKPWLIPDNAFSTLRNAYVYRSRVEKRPGSVLQNSAVANAEQLNYSRLAVRLGTTDAMGIFNALGAPNIVGNVAKAGQVFSVGNAIITVTALGAPATIITNTASAGAPATRVDLQTAAGNFVQFNFGVAYANLPVYYYPAEPVMGLDIFRLIGVNDELTFGFDTQFGYYYDPATGHWEVAGARPGLWQAAQPANAGMWTSSTSQFFWTALYWQTTKNISAIYATNNKPLSAAVAPNPTAGYDGIKAWNRSGALPGVWTNLVPVINAAGDTIIAALCIEVFKNALILFNVMIRSGAGDIRYQNRIHVCQADQDPFAANVWRTDLNSRGSELFLPTEEEITTIGLVKDRLLIYCERSTWELVFTGNPSQRFIIQKVNSELGAESTYSPVLFDRSVLAVGQVGITACNGTNVERIDEKIPTKVFQINNLNDGPIRVHGIRDYFNECVYWTYPDQLAQDAFPNKVLLYNYRNGSYAELDDSITTFGYDKNLQNIRWQDLNIAWEDVDRQWNDPSWMARFLPVLAGNQQGVCFKILNDVPQNANAQYITDIDFSVPGQATISCVNHNYAAGSYIEISQCQGENLESLNNTISSVREVVDVNTFIIGFIALDMKTYTGGGTIRRVSQIFIASKRFNLYQKEGYNFAIEKIDFNVNSQTSENAKITVAYSCNTNDFNQIDIPGTTQFRSRISLNPYAIYPWENGAESFWRTLYTNLQGSYIQFGIGYSPAQMLTPNSAFSDFTLNAVMLHTTPTSTRFQ